MPRSSMPRSLGKIAAGVLGIALVGGSGIVAASGPQGTTEAALSAGAFTLPATTAAADAVSAVGGGTATHVSRDTYQSQPVYDVHVLDAGQLWDVLVRMNGTTTNKHLATELAASGDTAPVGGPPPATSVTAAEQIAVQAVGGGTAVHASADHAGGVAVWDVHVLSGGVLYTVKVSQASGAVLTQRKSGEQPGTAGGEGAGRGPRGTEPRDGGGAPSPASGPGGLVYGRKYATAPAEFAPAVQSALAAVGGVALKWVKFAPKGSRQGSGDIQANIKIRLAHGTTKVKDLFNATGGLIAQRTQSGH